MSPQLILKEVAKRRKDRDRLKTIITHFFDLNPNGRERCLLVQYFIAKGLGIKWPQSSRFYGKTVPALRELGINKTVYAGRPMYKGLVLKACYSGESLGMDTGVHYGKPLSTLLCGDSDESE